MARAADLEDGASCVSFFFQGHKYAERRHSVPCVSVLTGSSLGVAKCGEGGGGVSQSVCAARHGSTSQSNLKHAHGPCPHFSPCLIPQGTLPAGRTRSTARPSQWTVGAGWGP